MRYPTHCKHSDLHAAGSVYNISLTFNPKLCDVVPACIGTRVNSTEGTGLIPGNGTNSTTGVYCASQPPICLPQNGCSCAFDCASCPETQIVTFVISICFGRAGRATSQTITPIMVYAHNIVTGINYILYPCNPFIIPLLPLDHICPFHIPVTRRWCLYRLCSFRRGG